MALLILAGALRADEGTVLAADREELIRLYDAIAGADDPRWLRDAKTIRRAYESGTFVEGVRQRVEVHGVALQRGNLTAAERAAGKPSRATVRVTRTGCAVYLLLCGYDAIDWRVEVAEGVDLHRVIVYGVRSQRVRGVAPSKVTHKDRVFVLNHRDREYARFSSVAARHVPGRSIHTYNGRVDPAGRAVVVGPTSAVWRRQMLLDSMRALERRALQQGRERELRALSRTLAPVIVWSPGGIRHQCDATMSTLVRDSMSPSPGTVFALTVNPETGHRYLLDHVQVQEYDDEGKYLRAIALPRWFQQGRYSGDIAFDLRRRRVVAVSLQGDFAEYPLATREWRAIGAQRKAVLGRRRGWGRYGVLTAMAWDAERDCFWSLYVMGRAPALHRHAPDGTPLGDPRSFRLPIAIQGGSRNGTFLRMVGSKLVLYTVEMVQRGRRRERRTSHSFVLDPDTAKLIGRHKLRDQPTIPAPLTTDLPQLWEELNSTDCYSAIRQAGRGDDETVAYLQAEWNKQPVIDADELRVLLRDLGASQDARRWDALRRLSQLGPAMRAALEREMGEVESPHVRMALLMQLQEIDAGPDLPRRLDQVLSEIGTERALEFRALVRVQIAKR